MPLGPFALISLFYLLIGARVVYQLVRGFRQTFDRNFTREDRALVDQAAFFILLPVAVALHELGHAVAIRLFGGDVLDWGFYGFAGYVAYDPSQFTATQQIVIAAAGTLVNLLLAAVALGLVFLKQPPFRAAINELLIQFTWISLLNALIVYPLLDIASGLNGDWTQMYGGGVPRLSLVILIIHITVLAALFWGWKSPKVRARVAELTDAASPPRRIATTGPVSGAVKAEETPAEQTLREAASRVTSGWPAPVEAALQRGRSGSALVLSWDDGGMRRSVIAIAPDTGGLELSGALQVGGEPPQRRTLGRDSGALDADKLTMLLRLAMETIEGWTPPLGEPASPSPTQTPTPAD
jgi:Zn-dependent protease